MIQVSRISGQDGSALYPRENVNLCLWWRGGSLDCRNRGLCCQPLHPFLKFTVRSHGQDYGSDELGDGGDIQRRH
jgi:hypothetical protein